MRIKFCIITKATCTIRNRLYSIPRICGLFVKKKTGYYTSNSQLLFLEMELKHGVSVTDYVNESNWLFNYLEHYDGYLHQKRLLENMQLAKQK